jgi:hypothetical protein
MNAVRFALSILLDVKFVRIIGAGQCREFSKKRPFGSDPAFLQCNTFMLASLSATNRTPYATI